MHFKRKQVILTLLVLATIGMILAVRFSPFLDQDRCLDSGGAWIDGRCLH
jgi:hypothetical protein